ncbi:MULTISPECIES: hypothetical protein [unclassified Streptomyces]|uniref:hypothetical protein n=1 Tax=unclassified Streptomyces TaxID=2593676 RepID=UPI003D75E085
MQRAQWSIAPQPPVANGETREGAIVLTIGTGHTGRVLPQLPDGMYKLTWTFQGQQGAAKQKVFRVDCGRPNGGPPAGGGGLAKEEAFTPVAGAAGVGLAAVAGAVWLRLRRRPHGSA